MPTPVTSASVSRVGFAATPKAARVIVFPNFPKELTVKAGSTIEFVFPHDNATMKKMAPAGSSHNGPALFRAYFLTKTDGVVSQPIEFGRPHNTGSGGFDRMETSSVFFKVPAAAKGKTIEYWLMGKTDGTVQKQGPQTSYWSNYGANFKLTVK